MASFPPDHQNHGSIQDVVQREPAEPDERILEWRNPDQKVSWKTEGRGVSTLRADSNVNHGSLTLRASEVPENGTARTVYVHLDEPSGRALATFLKDLYGL